MCCFGDVRGEFYFEMIFHFHFSCSTQSHGDFYYLLLVESKELHCSWLHHTDTSVRADTQWLRSQNGSQWKLFFTKFLWWLSLKLDPLPSLTQLLERQHWHTWEVVRKSDSWQKPDYRLAVTHFLVASFPHWYQLITVVEPHAKCQAESSRFHTIGMWHPG